MRKGIKPRNLPSTAVTVNVWKLGARAAAEPCSLPPLPVSSRTGSEFFTTGFTHRTRRPMLPVAFLAPWAFYEIFKQTLGILIKLNQN